MLKLDAMTTLEAEGGAPVTYRDLARTVLLTPPQGGVDSAELVRRCAVAAQLGQREQLDGEELDVLRTALRTMRWGQIRPEFARFVQDAFAAAPKADEPATDEVEEEAPEQPSEAGEEPCTAAP